MSSLSQKLEHALLILTSFRLTHFSFGLSCILFFRVRSNWLSFDSLSSGDCHFVYISFVYSGVVFCFYLYSAAEAGVNAILRNVIYFIDLSLF